MRKHAFDPASFVLGLVLSGAALIYLIAETQNRTVQGAWVLPLALIGLGLAAVVAGLSQAFRRDPEPDAEHGEPLGAGHPAEPADPGASDASG